jgi:hypothetical protein
MVCAIYLPLGLPCPRFLSYLRGPVPQMKPEDETMDIDGDANTTNPNQSIPQTQQDTYTSQGMCCCHPHVDQHHLLIQR